MVCAFQGKCFGRFDSQTFDFVSYDIVRAFDAFFDSKRLAARIVACCTVTKYIRRGVDNARSYVVAALAVSVPSGISETSVNTIRNAVINENAFVLTVFIKAPLFFYEHYITGSVYCQFFLQISVIISAFLCH